MGGDILEETSREFKPRGPARGVVPTRVGGRRKEVRP
jgi:hypothetical protein